MAFFKFPYTNYENINLDWLLRKIKALEPAIPLVEQSAAIVEEVHETAREAAAAAASAQQTVATVTALAEQANETAEEAKDIATQAASATIVDGSVTWEKLSTAVQNLISSIQSTANSASTAAEDAQETADNANSAAAAAQRTANSASTAAAAAQRTADSKTGQWTYAGALASGQYVTCPATTQEVLVEVIDSRASVRSIAAGVVRLDFSGSMQLYLHVVDVATYTMIDSTAKQVTFDPNLSAPSKIKAWVYYR